MRYKVSRNDQGTVLIVALILLVVLAFAASTSVMNSTTNIKVGANYSNTVGIFNLAELGIAKGKLILKNTNNFDELLNPATYPNGILIPSTDEGDGTYSVKVTNNNDTPLNPDTGGPTNDTDNIVILTSTGIGKTGAKVEIETYVGRPTSISFPGSPAVTGGGAVGVCGANPNVKAWGSGNVRGTEVDINGTNLSPATGTYGIVLENAGTVVEKKSDSVTGFLGDMAVNPSLACDEWSNLSNQLGSLGEGPNVLYQTGTQATGDWGTVANPKVVIINTAASSFVINGTLNGAGVVVVTSNTEIMVTGNLTFKGIVIIMGDDGAWISTGSSTVLGYVIVNNAIADPDLEVSYTGNGYVAYSSAAMAVAQNAIDGASGGGGGSGSQLITYSWSEKY